MTSTSDFGNLFQISFLSFLLNFKLGGILKGFSVQQPDIHFEIHSGIYVYDKYLNTVLNTYLKFIEYLP